MVAIPPPQMPTVEAIYKAYESKANNGFRDHLGASLIGGACDRAKWYTWRWMTRAVFPGRLLRLFETGNLAEARFVDDLRSIGVTVMDVDPDTGRQWTVRDSTGHFGGSMDGVCIGLPEAPKTYHGLEFKTHSEKSFNALKAKGVQASKPEHYGQMQTYMHLAQLTRFMYLAVNKNTDELYQERVQYDAEEGMRIVAHAGRIIRSPVPPGRISDDPTWFQCKMCQHHSACHAGNLPERHCRSCMHSTPVADGELAGKWRCELHGWILNSRMQRHGCGNGHKYIPAFIAGEQIDAAENAAWIDYKMGDGKIWRDSGKDK
jgi:hypothetical protein